MREFLNFGMEVKDLNEKDMSFEAYGSTFDTDLVNDRIEKGAWTGVIEKAKRRRKYPKLLYQHNYKDVVGVIEDLNEDERGLRVNGRFIDTTKGRDTYTETKEGAIDSMSIGFVIGEHEINKKTNIRTILEIKDLPEISFVTFPANPEATVVSIKKLCRNDDIINVRDLESILRDAGLSRTEAKKLLSGGMPELNLRDAEQQSKKTEEVKPLLNEKDLQNILKIIKGE